MMAVSPLILTFCRP